VPQIYTECINPAGFGFSSDGVTQMPGKASGQFRWAELLSMADGQSIWVVPSILLEKSLMTFLYLLWEAGDLDVLEHAFSPWILAPQGSMAPCTPCPVGRTTEFDPAHPEYQDSASDCFVIPGNGVFNSSFNVTPYNNASDFNLSVLACPVGSYSDGRRTLPLSAAFAPLATQL